MSGAKKHGSALILHRGACMSIEDPVCGMWRLHELIEDGTGHNLGADMGMGGGLRMSMFRFARAARSR